MSRVMGLRGSLCHDNGQPLSRRLSILRNRVAPMPEICKATRQVPFQDSFSAFPDSLLSARGLAELMAQGLPELVAPTADGFI